MRELCQFLNANPLVAQDFHNRPGPECAVILLGEVVSSTGFQVVRPDLGYRVLGDRSAPALSRRGDLAPRPGGLHGRQSFGGEPAFGVHSAGQRGQNRKPRTGPLVHA